MSNMTSVAVQNRRWTAGIFSSPLFCLWLSLASVVVWFDRAPVQTPATASGRSAAPAMDVPATAAPADTKPATGDPADNA